MPAQLLALDDGPSILLDKPILLLGRHPECDIQIDSRKISRRHCCIAQVNDFLVVRDLGSTNGVRINGVRVLEGRLNDGDELTIGTTRYQVTWEDEAGNVAGRKAAPVVRPKPPVPPAEDDLLESSDEPVPLPDPDSPPHFDPSRPVKMDEAEEEGLDGPSSPVLPADLDLLPISHAGLSTPPPPPEPNPSV
jgi:predicted component of type VI protein secretion system